MSERKPKTIIRQVYARDYISYFILNFHKVVKWTQKYFFREENSLKQEM